MFIAAHLKAFLDQTILSFLEGWVSFTILIRWLLLFGICLLFLSFLVFLKLYGPNIACWLNNKLQYSWKFLKIKQRYPNPSPISYLLLTGALISLFLLITLIISLLREGRVLYWNQSIFAWMQTIHVKCLEDLLTKVTLVDTEIIAIMWACVSILLLSKRQLWAAQHWIALGFSILPLTSLIKVLVRYPRPLGLEHTSFPSGHVTAHTALLGSLLVLFYAHHSTPSSFKKILSYLAYFLWIGLISFSRLYLQAHWLTDILGGLLLGIGSVLLFKASYQRKVIPLSTREQVLGTTLCSTILAWSINLLLQE